MKREKKEVIHDYGSGVRGGSWETVSNSSEE